MSEATDIRNEVAAVFGVADEQARQDGIIGMCERAQSRIAELERELAEARGQEKCCPDCGRLWLKDKACPWCEADEAREDKQQAEQRAERYKAALVDSCGHRRCWCHMNDDNCTTWFCARALRVLRTNGAAIEKQEETALEGADE